MNYDIEDVIMYEGVEWVVSAKCKTFYVITRKGVDRKKLTSNDIIKINC